MVTPSPPGGWDFSPGDRIHDEVFSRFSSPVHFSRFFSRRPFQLVVDFPRASFRLCSSSVGIALRACIGGSPGDLFDCPQKDRSYSFLVCSKAVGIWIYNLCSFICKDFHARFHLWRDGGPNWQKEWMLWCAEQNSEWTLVSRKSKKFDSVHNHSRKSYIKTVIAAKPINHPKFSSSKLLNLSKVSATKLINPPKVSAVNKSSNFKRPTAGSSKGPISNAESLNVVPVKSVFDRLRFPEIAAGKAPARDQGGSDPPFKAANQDMAIVKRPMIPPFCDRCLMHGHREFECVNRVRCASCHKLDHRALAYWNKKKAQVWRPKKDSMPAAKKSIVERAVLGKEIICFKNQGSPSSSSQKLQSAPLLLLTSSPSAPMAVVNPDPAFFLPLTLQLLEPWDHQLERADLCLQEDPPKRNEGMAVACIESPPTPEQYEGFRHLVINYVQNVLGYHVLEASRHPIEFMYVRVASALLRDTLIAGGPYEVDNQFMLRFVPHDLTSSCRNSPFTSEGWTMFLDFPLDFKTPAIIDKAVSLFGKVIKVQLDDNVRGRLMVKALYSSTLEVPRRIVIKRATAFGGVGRSWTVSVFLCHGELPDVMPGDEDLPPVNHIPIPDPVQLPAPQVDAFGDNMEEDAPAIQQNSQPLSAVSLVAGNLNVMLQSQGSITLEQLMQPRFLVNPFFWKMLNALNAALSSWEDYVPKPQVTSAFSLLPLSPQWSRVVGPSQELQIISYSLPITHIIQFALLAAVLLVAGNETEVEQAEGDLGHEYMNEAHMFEDAEMVEPISCVLPEQQVLPQDPFHQSASSCLPSLKKSRKTKAKTVAIVDTDRRRSSRINKLTGGYMSPDPKQGVGKPRGKSAKRLKLLAEQSGIISFLHPLPPEFFETDDNSDSESPPIECSIQMLQTMGTNLCGLKENEVSAQVLTTPAGLGSGSAATSTQLP